MIKKIKQLLESINIFEVSQTLEQFYNDTDFYGEYAKWAYANIPDYMYDGSQSPIGDFIDLYAENEGIEPFDVDVNSDEFIEWLYDEMGWAFDNVYQELDSELGDSSTIILFRAVKINGDYLQHLTKQGKHLGVYWTNDLHKAKSYWGDDSNLGAGGDDYILEVEVPQTYVDWRHTLLQRWVSPEEKEIRLNKGVPLKLKGLYNSKREPLDISTIRGRLFYA